MAIEQIIRQMREKRQEAIGVFNSIYKEVPKYNNHLELRGDYVIASDWHAPYFSDRWAERMIMVCDRLGIKKFICAGDFLDQKAFSEFTPSSYQDESPDEEQTRCGYLLATICDQFDEVILSVGNHDKRLFKMLCGKQTFRRTIQAILEERHDNLKISEYPYILLNAKKTEISGQTHYVDGWRITHPKNYSMITAKVPTRAADKYAMNIVSAHGHHFGFSYSHNGRYICIDNGGMFDLLKQEYVMYSDTNHPHWNNGFTIIKNNKPYLFHDLTDWKYWGCK